MEYIVLIGAWVAMTICMVLLIPRERIREATLIFFFKQMLTWLVGLIVVEIGLIEYPVRLFPRANGTSFTFEYFVYPALCAIFNIRYPLQKSRLIQFLYYCLFCTFITIVEVVAERYTDIIRYVHWTWYYTWLSLFATFYLSRRFYLWFFKAYPCSGVPRPVEKKKR